MKLVSENSEEALARRNALAELEWKLPALAANLLRVCAGAGKPGEIGAQIAAVAAIWATLERLGPLPDDAEFHRILDVERYPGLEGEHARWERGIHNMVRGSLRMAAAQLLDQTSQRSAGEELLFRGLEVVEAIRERNRAGARARSGKTAKPTPMKRGSRKSG